MKQLPPDTPEQSLITQYKGPRLVVKAYAGTGKTTTLVKYAHNNLDSRILYLAYNRAIRDEAREKFPANVDCKTSHQLAYATIGGLTLSGTKTHVKQRFLPLTPLLMVSDVLWSPVLPA